MPITHYLYLLVCLFVFVFFLFSFMHWPCDELIWICYMCSCCFAQSVSIDRHNCVKTNISNLIEVYCHDREQFFFHSHFIYRVSYSNDITQNNRCFDRPQTIEKKDKEWDEHHNRLHSFIHKPILSLHLFPNR